MKTNKIVIATLVSATVFSGGSFFLIKSYAETGVQPAAVEIQNVESVAPVQEIDSPTPDPSISGVYLDVINIQDEENFVPNLVGNEISLKTTSSSIQVLEQTDTIARSYPNNHLRLSTSYTLQDGILVDFAQNPSDKNMTVDQEVETFKGLYPADINTVKEVEINGHKGLTVENEVRKVVHVFTDKHTFTISTVSINGSLEPLLEIAKEIK